jgi:hypothetical protein
MGCYNFGSILLNIMAEIYFNAPTQKKLGADFVKPVTAVICVEATTKKLGMLKLTGLVQHKCFATRHADGKMKRSN